MIGATKHEIEAIRSYYPQFRHHLAMTPRSALSGVLVGEYVWTPIARELPGRVRMTLRGMLAPLIDTESVEECFPDTLLSW